MEDAAVTVIAVLMIAAFLTVVYGPSVIALLKGQIVWGMLGILLFPPFGWEGALMTAKPGSWWARNRYDDDQMAAAIAKHGEPAAATSSEVTETVAGDDADWVCGICGETSATKVAAEAHVRGSHPQA